MKKAKPVINDFKVPLKLAADKFGVDEFLMSVRLGNKLCPVFIDAKGNKWAWATDIAFSAIRTKAPRVALSKLELAMLDGQHKPTF